jgi:hypothetical protein
MIFVIVFMTKGDLMITMEMVGVIEPKTLVSIGTFATILFFWFSRKCPHGSRSHGFHNPSGDFKKILFKGSGIHMGAITIQRAKKGIGPQRKIVKIG